MSFLFLCIQLLHADSIENLQIHETGRQVKATWTWNGSEEKVHLVVLRKTATEEEWHIVGKYILPHKEYFVDRSKINVHHLDDK